MTPDDDTDFDELLAGIEDEIAKQRPRFKSIIEGYLADFESNARRLSADFSSEEARRSLQTLAHDTKGMAGSVGFSELSSIADCAQLYLKRLDNIDAAAIAWLNEFSTSMQDALTEDLSPETADRLTAFVARARKELQLA